MLPMCAKSASGWQLLLAADASLSACVWAALCPAPKVTELRKLRDAEAVVVEGQGRGAKEAVTLSAVRSFKCKFK